jgi:hypothetical protein
MRRDQHLLDGVLSDHYYDPQDRVQRDALLRVFNVEISREDDESLPGWSRLWKYGGGLACPLVPEDEARSIIALSCYLYLVGVEVSLCDTLAYWYFRGPDQGKLDTQVAR